MNTNIKVKMRFLPDFFKEMEKQLLSGGKRYALTEEMESTDLVCLLAGNKWVGGNIVKYVAEIRNAKMQGEPLPENDFFKIAVYAFLWWLKEKENLTKRDKGEEL